MPGCRQRWPRPGRRTQLRTVLDYKTARIVETACADAPLTVSRGDHDLTPEEDRQLSATQAAPSPPCDMTKTQANESARPAQMRPGAVRLARASGHRHVQLLFARGGLPEQGIIDGVPLRDLTRAHDLLDKGLTTI